MFNDSRLGIYKYIENLLIYDVTKNVYFMNEPQELSASDAKDGFIVINIGNLNDAGEFDGELYAWARVYVRAYVPLKARGKMNEARYSHFENSISDVIRQASEDSGGEYWIQTESLLSTDLNEEYDANNSYSVFVKSFIITVNNKNSN